jgi:hypothetical protein
MSLIAVTRVSKVNHFDTWIDLCMILCSLPVYDKVTRSPGCPAISFKQRILVGHYSIGN